MKPATLLLIAAPLSAADFASDRERVLALGELVQPPSVHPAEGFTQEDGLKPIFFDALPSKGRPTRVFAWLGLPAGLTDKAPGIVLVHGGGGTAFKDWVSQWNQRGYAAISIAVEGQTDKPAEVPPGARRQWARHKWGGPKRDGIYADTDEPLANQWMYHAVADTVLANSLLRSLPEVNADEVGLMGISWGGVITSTVIGIDSRFAFAIPTYGSGHLFDSENHWGAVLGENMFYREVWDPMLRIARAKLPVLWLSWPGDRAFPLDCQAACYRAAPGPRMVSLIPGMGHSHRAGWTPPDSYAFADSVIESGEPWLSQRLTEAADGEARVEFSSAKALDSATLIWTADQGFTGDRAWNETPAKLTQAGDRWRATAPLPPTATAWFINVRSGRLTGSSDYQEP